MAHRTASVVAFAPLDGALWFATDPRSGNAQAMRANPQVAIMFEGNGAEVYVWGDVELLGDPETRRRLWEQAPMPYDKAAFFGDPDNERVVSGPGHAATGDRRAHGPERSRPRALVCRGLTRRHPAGSVPGGATATSHTGGGWMPALPPSTPTR